MSDKAKLQCLQEKNWIIEQIVIEQTFKPNPLTPVTKQSHIP